MTSYGSSKFGANILLEKNNFNLGKLLYPLGEVGIGSQTEVP